MPRTFILVIATALLVIVWWTIHETIVDPTLNKGLVSLGEFSVDLRAGRIKELKYWAPGGNPTRTYQYEFRNDDGTREEKWVQGVGDAMLNKVKARSIAVVPVGGDEQVYP